MRSRLLALALVLAATVPARAESADELKKQAISAARAKDWDTARKKFEAAYELDRLPLTLYNLATAQEQTGRLLAARANFIKFLETVPGDNSKFRKLAKAAIARLDADIPTVQIRLEGFTASVVVELDGAALSAAALAAPIQLDPGKHVIVASRGTDELTRREVVAIRGARQETVLNAPPPPVTDPVRPIVERSPTPVSAPPRRVDEGGLLSSGWFWLATGVVVLGAAGAGYYYVIADAPVRAPTQGTLGGFTLR